MKFLLLLMLVFGCGWCSAQGGNPPPAMPADAVPARYMPLLVHKRVALVMNQTSKVGDSLLVDMLLARHVDVKRILSPEHGFRGKEDAGAHVDNSVDSATGLPVVSLYGKHKKPTAEDLADVDVVVYDLQDVGVRFYTYISTLEYVMEACAVYLKQLVVLDRPDPNGFYIDGPVLEDEHKSFVGMQRVPVVYGMTAGEYAKMIKGETTSPRPSPKEREVLTDTVLTHKKLLTVMGSLDLKVITCLNYDHQKKYELPVAPSPNLRNMAAVYAYPSLCLFEGTPVSVGRGTDMPFQQWGSPEYLGKFDHSFIPMSREGAKHPPYETVECYGELVGKTAAEVLKKIDNRMHLDWLIKAYNADKDKEHFFTPFFVQLCGTTKVQEMIKSGATEEEIRKSWRKDIEAFKVVRKKYLLYSE